MTINQIGFLLMGLIAVFGALGVVFLQSPVRAAISLVVNFFVLGLLYFTLGTQLLGISQIMVYAGAIMVLFLFVIMVLKSDGKREKPELKGMRGVGAVIGFGSVSGILIMLVAVPFLEHTTRRMSLDYGRPQAIGYELFTSYVWPFEVISVLLLVGIVGSIMLAKRRF